MIREVNCVYSVENFSSGCYSSDKVMTQFLYPQQKIDDYVKVTFSHVVGYRRNIIYFELNVNCTNN